MLNFIYFRRVIINEVTCQSELQVTWRPSMHLLFLTPAVVSEAVDRGALRLGDAHEQVLLLERWICVLDHESSYVHESSLLKKKYYIV